VLPDLGLGFARFWAVEWRYVNRHVAGILWLLPFAAMGTEVCSADKTALRYLRPDVGFPFLDRKNDDAVKVAESSKTCGSD
jgi:hypothetical protein